MFDDKTMTFSLGQNREDDIKQILTIVYDALKAVSYTHLDVYKRQYQSHTGTVNC